MISLESIILLLVIFLCGDSFSLYNRIITCHIKSGSHLSMSVSSHTTRVKRNFNFSKLSGGYLFPEIGRRRDAFLSANPSIKDRIISLGIGDTTLPIPPYILSGLIKGATKLGTKEGYTGYGAEKGRYDLRALIANNIYPKDMIRPDEVFVSDGAKCDIMRIQQMFGPDVRSAVQDPSYPVYVDTSVMMGQTGTLNNHTGQYENILYMPCTPENNFFPDYAAMNQRADIIYICSPNNPTGAVATHSHLSSLIKACKEKGSILVYDAAYAPFIRSPGIPKSIFEIDGARDVAVEVNSWSKYAGFTGVRLGWTVIPSSLKFSDGSLVKDDFNRVMTTAFNGASNISQEGGMACLTKEGQKEISQLIDYYLYNANLLKHTMEELGYIVYGGTDAPYIFLKLPPGTSSWDAFTDILERVQVITIPGAGFGPGGEGYLRLSAFAPRCDVEMACNRMKEKFSVKK